MGSRRASCWREGHYPVSDATRWGIASTRCLVQAFERLLPLTIQAVAWLAVVGMLGGCLPALRDDPVTLGEWPSYGNDVGGTRYSPLAQIDRGNVGRLRVAWTYRTGEVGGVSPGGWGSPPSRPLPS